MTMTIMESLHDDALTIARKFTVPSWTAPDGVPYCLRGRIYRAVHIASGEADNARRSKMGLAIEGMDQVFLALMAEFMVAFERYRETAKFVGEDWETEFSVPPCQCPGCRALAEAAYPTMRVENKA